MEKGDQSDQSDNQYSDSHNEEYHNDYLTQLCRLCSARLNSAKQKKEKNGRVYNVQNYAAAINTEFGINVTTDRPGVHPSNFCNKCRTAITNFKRNPSSQCNIMKKQDIRDVNCRWNTIGENIATCFTCHTFIHQTKRGPRKSPPPLPVQPECIISEPAPLSDITNSELHHPKNLETASYSNDNAVKSPSKITVKEMLSSKNEGPPTALDHKLLNCLLDKFDKSNPLIEIKTGGTVSIE